MQLASRCEHLKLCVTCSPALLPPAVCPQGWVALHAGDFVHFAIDTSFPGQARAGEEVTLAVAYLA